MRLRPQDIQEQKFKTSFRGFDTAEVDSFLDRVSDELERLIEERDALERELKKETAKRDQLEEALGSARHLQQSIIEKAKEDARVTMHQARLLGERITSEARDEMMAIKKEIVILKDRRNTFLAEISSMADAILKWTTRIENDIARDEAEERAPQEEAPEQRELVTRDEEVTLVRSARTEESRPEEPAKIEEAQPKAPPPKPEALGGLFAKLAEPSPMVDDEESGLTMLNDDALDDELALIDEYDPLLDEVEDTVEVIEIPPK